MLRVLVLVLFVGTAHAKRMPAPPDVQLKRTAVTRLKRAEPKVMKCSQRHNSFVERLSVAVVFRPKRVDVNVPAKGNDAFQKCVRDVVKEAVRGVSNDDVDRDVTVIHLFKVEMRVIE